MRSRITNRSIALVAVIAAASSLAACGTDGATPKCNDTQEPFDASDPDATVLMGDCLYGPGYATSSDGGTPPPGAQ